MYKLYAKLPSGVTFITCSQIVTDLQRIAVNLGANSFHITLHGERVYSQWLLNISPCSIPLLKPWRLSMRRWGHLTGSIDCMSGDVALGLSPNLSRTTFAYKSPPRSCRRKVSKYQTIPLNVSLGGYLEYCLFPACCLRVDLGYPGYPVGLYPDLQYPPVCRLFSDRRQIGTIEVTIEV